VDSRTPPHNLDAEKSVLGSILLDNDVFAALEGTLSAERFYKEGHRKIFRAMERLFRRNEPTDLVTLTEELRQSGDLEAVGSVPYLIGLADGVPTAAYAESYAKIVHEKSVLRDLIGASGRIMQSAYEGAAPLDQVLDEAEGAIFDLATSKRRSYFEGMPQLVHETFGHINELFTNPDPVSGLRTGFKELDVLTAGLQPSSLNVLAARPSMGKCLGRGTKVVLFDGRLVAVEELRVGDQLMGPDSQPRRVLSLARGRQAMYWVRQRHGVDYRVNESHVLSLKRRGGGRDEVVNLSLREWLARPPAAARELLGYKVAVEFPARPLPVDPYLVGLRLGAALEGGGVGPTPGRPRGSSAHPPSLARSGGATAAVAPGWDLAVGGQPDPIAHEYLAGSRHARLELLAGLLDSGPRPPAPDAPIEFVTDSTALARQLKFLCDSLGYRTSLTTAPAGVRRGGGPRAAQRLRVVGDTGEIPARAGRHGAAWCDPRDWRLTEVDVEPDGVGEYFGFTLSGDGLFLLEDMTVTHNTAFALTILLNAALREGTTVGIFSLEMSGVQLVTRMLCSEARVDMSRVRNGQLSDRDFQRLADTAGRMSEARVFIDDNADLTVMELRSRARRLMAEHDVGLIIVDYLQLMSGAGLSARGGENRQQEISTISRGLKALARELDIPILVLSQLSRAVESRPNKRPMLSDLRECVTGDTLVVLADGRRVPIRDLVGTTPEVVSVDTSGRIVTVRSEAVWSVGERPVFEVRLASGRSVRATAEHRLLAADGWRRVSELAAGARLALARAVPRPAKSDRWPDRRVSRIGDEKLPVRAEGVTRRRMAAMRGTWHGGPAHLAVAPSRAVVRAYADLPDDERLRGRGGDEPFWDTIVDIEDAGVEEVFDLTVPLTASWLADGIVSHNSGAIEQDADLVMFIYRDEYYDPHSEKQGIAEIIIGKQRNGPVGSLELQFHNAHVRFNDLARSGG
jgi:replicative DNA helicase